MTPEKKDLTIGFIALSDCAPVIMAQEKGFFEKHGLDVTLSKERSWARIRDKLAWGELDGAHMLAPMVLASVLGLEKGIDPFVTALSLNLNGNAITVSNDLYDAMNKADPCAMLERPISARALRKVVADRLMADKEPLTFAMVFPFSSHNYQLRYWLAAEGIHPDKDVRLVVVPPAKVMDEMQAGAIDGYCVGEPWNSAAVGAGIGKTVITTHEFWGTGPEKVFGVSRKWAEAHPSSHFAALSAILETCVWLQSGSALEETAATLAKEKYVGVPAKRILPSLIGRHRRTAGDIIVNMPDFGVYYRYAANFPWHSHAGWFITQMYRWGQIEEPVNIRHAAQEAYDTALFRDVAGKLGVPYPLIDEKPEGGRDHPWVLKEASEPIAFGPANFIDGRVYDPTDPVTYIEGFERHRLKVSIGALRDANS